MISMEESIVRLQEELKKAHKDIVYINETLRMERELYVNIRELLKEKSRECDRLKDRVKELEEKLEKNI